MAGTLGILPGEWDYRNTNIIIPDYSSGNVIEQVSKTELAPVAVVGLLLIVWYIWL